jgi:hypothetical protein
MKRLLILCLVIGALTGLVGVQAAYALGPALIAPAAPTVQAATTGYDMAGMNCAEMMAPATSHPAEHGSQPCKGMTPACIAQMGCTLPVLLVRSPSPAARIAISRAAVPPASSRPLEGHADGPEPEPPTVLI